MKQWKMAMVVAGCVMAAGVKAQQAGAASKTALERGPHETRWEHLAEALDAEGNSVVVTNSFVELGTGLNRWDAEAGAWVPASAEIEIVNGRGIARGSQHKVIFAGNANDPNGTIELFSPEGDHFVLQTVGLAYTERGTGRSVFIAEVRDSEGIVVGASSVVYPDAFDGVRADIRCETSLGGFQSDVILREKISAPEEYGLDGRITQLEVWHQVLRQPEMQRTARKVERRDGREDWDGEAQAGSLKFAAGNAFALGREEARSEVQVTKEWVGLEGMDFLIEALPVDEAREELEALPEALEARRIPREALGKAFAGRSGAGRAKPVSMAGLASEPNPRPAPQFAGLSRGILPDQPGYLIDYTTVNTSQTNYTFKGDTTYYIPGIVELYGSGNILEGGAVIKFAGYTNLTPRLDIRGTLTCKTSPYNPAIFTAKDDDTVGETISGSTGSPTNYYSWYNLRYLDSGAVELHNIRSKHSHNAVGINRSGTHTVWNYQSVKCDKGLNVSGGTVNLFNALVVDMHYAIQATSANSVVNAEHLTVDNSQILLLHNSLGVMRLTNTLTVNITDAISGITASNQWVNLTGSGIFKAVGKGGRYLADSSPHRGVGTTNLSATTLAILPLTTTHAPVELSTGFTVDTVLYPTAPRDVDTPDLGYHYPPLDYMVGSLNLTNATLVVTNGVAMAKHGIAGFYMKTGGNFRSQGTPATPNRLVNYQAVQEQTGLLGTNATIMAWFHGAASGGDMRLNFTEVAFLAETSNRRRIWYQTAHAGGLHVKNSTLRNAHQSINPYSTATTIPFELRNTLVERSSLLLDQWYGSAYYALSASFYNNLLRDSAVTLKYGATSYSFGLYDNVFESCALSETGSAATYNGDNAYKSTTALAGGSGNITLAAMDWQSGPLGPYYYPTSGTNLFSLVDAGSRTVASAGLYHHTTRTDQTKDSGTVDIGFHYVAVDSAGQPLDADFDGIPDYLEDADGDNALDTGETAWATSTGGVGTSVGMVLFTILE
jgi:hypothetical protein